jgi:hypothetical protein
MLSSGANVIIWEKNVIICDAMLSSGAIMISSGTKCYHLGLNVIIWDEILSSGMKCYHLGCNVIIWS